MVIEKRLNILPRQAPAEIEKVIKELKSSGLPAGIIFDLKLSLNEALINAAKHGNKSDKNKPVYLRIEKKKDKLEALIKDQGQGFDWIKLKSPLCGRKLTKPSGRGIFLIKQFMDEVKFLNGGNTLKMVKYLKKKEAE